MRLFNMQLVGLACFCFEEEGVGWVRGFFDSCHWERVKELATSLNEVNDS